MLTKKSFLGPHLFPPLFASHMWPRWVLITMEFLNLSGLLINQIISLMFFWLLHNLVNYGNKLINYQTIII